MLKPVAGFAAFGLFWGAWGAVLPAIRVDAGVNDGELGVALLMIGLGALVSMRFTGYLIDRYGGVVLPVVTVLFALCGVLPALAGSVVTLSAALLLLGATSGATDVAINATGSQAEHDTGRPVMNFAHGMFSVAVVVASLGTAGLRAAGVGALPVLAGAAALIVITAAAALAPGATKVTGTPRTHTEKPRARLEPVLLVFGVLCALAYLVENAWQSWGAVHLDTSLNAAAGLASSAPAVFAAAAATGRFAGNALLARVRPVRLLVVGGAVAAVGSLVAATANNPWTALIGIGVAGLGTSVCAPTIIGMAGAWAGPERRAGAISTVTTIAYVGFLIGPAAVGAVSSALSLPVALGAVAVIAVVVAGLAPAAGRAAKPQASRQPG
ncbi:fucose permease [Kribbella sp. VKM Ac-2569]|uniref:MFS transporter n=1 Tax=Kribbella sp. VKM Ac-2569 TaxID=2512220 RepID=UPI00102CCBAC|nr:MFS transporter [Kribbella sp. VKM Ac-2569]RZT28606.1 fucose permease [Kribbella sp. VKM Ac-2569]